MTVRFAAIEGRPGAQCFWVESTWTLTFTAPPLTDEIGLPPARGVRVHQTRGLVLDIDGSTGTWKAVTSSMCGCSRLAGGRSAARACQTGAAALISASECAWANVVFAEALPDTAIAYE